MHLSFAVDLDQAQARGLTNEDVEDVKQLMKDVVVLALTVRPARRTVMRVSATLAFLQSKVVARSCRPSTPAAKVSCLARL